jgi:hypothetical protein
MGLPVHAAVIALQVIVYGGLLALGCMLWYRGWKRGDAHISRAGDVAVLLGLWTDAALIAAQWLFNWAGWIEARIVASL